MAPKSAACCTPRADATHKSKAEIEHVLAERFPRQDVPAQIQVFQVAPAPGPVDDAFHYPRG